MHVVFPYGSHVRGASGKLCSWPAGSLWKSACDAQVAKLWWLQRDAVLHYIRAVHPNAGEHKNNDNTQQAAQNKFRKYCSAM